MTSPARPIVSVTLRTEKLGQRKPIVGRPRRLWRIDRLIRSSTCGHTDRSDQSMTSLASPPVVQGRPEPKKVVRPGGSPRGSQWAGSLPPRTRYLSPNAPGIYPVTARTFQGMAPFPGQARCLALGFWSECFRRLDVKGGRRPFPEETRSTLMILRGSTSQFRGHPRFRASPRLGHHRWLGDRVFRASAR